MGKGDHCAVFGCGNDRRYPTRYKVKQHVQKLQFHHCPPRFFSKWRTFLNLQEPFRVTGSTRICSNHFVDARPTRENPHPTLYLKGDPVSPKKRIRRHHSHHHDCEGQQEQLSDMPEPSSSGRMATQDFPLSLPVGLTDRDHPYFIPNSTPLSDLPGSPSSHHLTSSQSSSSTATAELSSQPEATAEISHQAMDISHISHSPHLMKTFTGLNNFAKFNWLFNTVKHNIPHLQYFKGKSQVGSKYYQKNITEKPGPNRKLSHENELLLTLMKLKLDLLYEDLAFRFSISVSLVSQILSTWIPLLAKELHGLIYWPSRDEIQSYYPTCFNKWSNVRAIVDCTEIPLQRPSLPKANSQIYSNYKSRPTAKLLIACTPGGTISFVSKTAGGAMSDKELFKASGLLQKLDPTDVILADRGFNIQELLAPLQVKLVIPPFLRKSKATQQSSSSGPQFSNADCVLTKQVANARIHVERVIGRLKEFQILREEYPLYMLDLLDNIVTVCAVLVNLQPPMVPLQ